MSRTGGAEAGWGERARLMAAGPHAAAVAGAALGLLGVGEAVARAALAGAGPQSAPALLLLALSSTLPLALLPPVGAAVAVSAACVLSLAAFHVLTIAGMVALMVALHRFGTHAGERRGAWLLATVLAVPFPLLALTGPRPIGSEAGILTLLLTAAAPAAAWAGIARRARSEARTHGAARQVIAGTLLEHTARGERARIARELHDVVAHHVSMVAVQAETARLATPGMPPAGARQLSEIGDTARAALTEMRRLLGVLREDAGTGAADLRPQPGLGQLNELLDEARRASGAGARLILRGAPVALDPGLELAAYRIVQEALTNTRRHAPGAAVDVELHYARDGLRLRVRDNGPGAPAADPGGGHGLLGMGERAAAVGGELRTGPAAGGGFLVEAVLPARVEALG